VRKVGDRCIETKQLSLTSRIRDHLDLKNPEITGINARPDDLKKLRLSVTEGREQNQKSEQKENRFFHISLRLAPVKQFVQKSGSFDKFQMLSPCILKLRIHAVTEELSRSGRREEGFEGGGADGEFDGGGG
jgi:hypothetical protein